MPEELIGVRTIVNPARRQEERWINLSALPDTRKRKMWKRLKEERPGVAALLAEIQASPECQAFIAAFDCSIEVEALPPMNRRGDAS